MDRYTLFSAITFLLLIAAALSAPAPAEKQAEQIDEKQDLVASEKDDLKTAATHWGGGHWGGYGGYGGYGGWGGYGSHWGYPGYYGSWGYPQYSSGYGYWPYGGYGHYGHGGYWW